MSMYKSHDLACIRAFMTVSVSFFSGEAGETVSVSSFSGEAGVEYCYSEK